MSSRRSSSRNAGKPSSDIITTSSSSAPSEAKRKLEGNQESGKASVKKIKPAEVKQSDKVAAEKGNGIAPEGKDLPKIKLKDESGKEVDISQLKKTVLFTYPKANTPGCTTQACLFRDEYAEFQKIGFQVFGLSSDGETSLKNWKEKKSFKYSLLSDPKRELIGVLTGSKSSTIRSHFLIDANGKVAHSAIKVKPADSSSDALKVAKTL